MFVNATRVGAGDLIDQCVIDEDMLHEGLTVADTVYNPVESKLIKMAKAHGLAAYGGLGMLLQQAALAEKIWFGTDMPIELIQEKLFSSPRKATFGWPFFFCVEEMTKERFE